MKLVKRLIELAVFLLLISLFMKNKDVELTINYFGLSEPLKVQFWELVTFCVALGVIIAAVADLITQFKWVSEKRRLIKNDKEFRKTTEGLNQRIAELESENESLQSEKERLKNDLDSKTKDLEATAKDLQTKTTELETAKKATESKPTEAAPKAPSGGAKSEPPPASAGKPVATEKEEKAQDTQQSSAEKDNAKG